MNTIEQNRKLWTDHGWETKGEHWSVGWGNSDAQWNFSLRPRIARHIPQDSILEIATGYGRWTRFMVEQSKSYIGIDLVEKCANHCREKFGGPNRRFFHNDGLHLTGVPDKSIDFVFSFDSLVHVNWDTLKSYLTEILRVLKPGGSAFIHHSNAADVPNFSTMTNEQKAFRGPDVSARLVRDEVEKLGGGVRSQELVDWGKTTPAMIDCFTAIETQKQETVIIENPDFMQNMRQIRKISAIYSEP